MNPEYAFVIGYKIAERIKRPATIEGTPLIAWTRKRMGFVNRPRISVRYRAVRIPTGTLSMSEIVTSVRVPVIACNNPPLVSGSVGVARAIS